MIVSHRHRYVFVELPRTGSWAIHHELREHYDGVPVLEKHTPYHRFLRGATEEERGYFVFAGIRNPLDEAVSLYFWEKNDRAGHYTDPSKLRRRGGHVSKADLRRFRYLRERGADFATYFERFYRHWKIHRYPYDNYTCLDHHRFDYVIRFERLQEDFSRVLDLLGIEPVRPLPVVNRTPGKEGDFRAFYPPEIRERAVRVFGPYMERWGYEFPPDWDVGRPPLWSRVAFRALRPVRRFYWRRVGYRSWPARVVEHFLP